MNTIHQTAVTTGDKESKMKITNANLIRWAGLSAMVGGFLFVAIQPLHPPDILSSVTTSSWAIVHYVGVAMCLLILLGLSGIYARQAEKAGWLGLAGFLMLSFMWALTAAFQFFEAIFSPLLAIHAPSLEEGILHMVSNSASAVSLGALPIVWSIVGVLYLLGGVLFGIATFRAGILPRWAAALLAFGTVLPIFLSSLFPHPLDRFFAVPVGIALAWLGYALWSERREPAVEAVAGRGIPSSAIPELSKVA